jgi:recombination protein U
MKMTTQDYRNIIRGKKNRASGEYFEQIINAACAHYEKEGKAVIIKTPEPMRPLRSIGNGRFEACFAKKAQPDFKGVLAGGQAIVFEAKHTDTGKLARSVVSDEQIRALDRHRRMGASCFVIVSFGFTDCFKIPWEVFVRMKELYGREYITPDDVEEYRIPCAGGVLEFLGKQQ